MVTEDGLLARNRSQALQFLSPIGQHVVDSDMFSRLASMAIPDASRTWGISSVCCGENSITYQPHLEDLRIYERISLQQSLRYHKRMDTK